MSNFTSLQRVLTTLGFKEPDRVPFFLLLTMHGAKELGLTIKEYFSKPENVVEGQLRLRKKYKHDCIYAFYYAAIETEACGGNVIYFDDGPPNNEEPLIKNIIDIKNFEHTKVKDSDCLKKVLTSIELLKEKVKDDVPIIGVVMSPFSLPVMQLGYDKYIEILYNNPELFNILMQKNQNFCIEWANAQLEAGATAICYFDPGSSTTNITKQMYENTGFKVAKNTISKINGPVATHFASGRCIPILDKVVETGTAMIGVSALENIEQIKNKTYGKINLLGNLNGIEMRKWTSKQTEQIVKELISKASKGGGFILSDNHGEIPFQVSDEVLYAISETVHKWGKYPCMI